MLQVFAHSDLPHQLVLVPVHPCQLPHMGKDVLETICQLLGEGRKRGGDYTDIRILYVKVQLIFHTATRHGHHLLTWKASTFPSLYWTWLSTTSLVRRSTSRHRWKALPKRDFFLSCKAGVGKMRCREYKGNTAAPFTHSAWGCQTCRGAL